MVVWRGWDRWCPSDDQDPTDCCGGGAALGSLHLPGYTRLTKHQIKYLSDWLSTNLTWSVSTLPSYQHIPLLSAYGPAWAELDIKYQASGIKYPLHLPPTLCLSPLYLCFCFGARPTPVSGYIDQLDTNYCMFNTAIQRDRRASCYQEWGVQFGISRNIVIKCPLVLAVQTYIC